MDSRGTSFAEFYQAELIRLKLAEGTHRETTFLGKTHWFFGRVKRIEPLIVGVVLEKPIQSDAGFVGRFRATAGIAGPVWDLAGSIEKQFGVESEIVVDPSYPS